jgi:2-aminoadipate transaminase
VIREILKVTERPGIISLAGGLPSPKTFPVEAMREATARVLREHGRARPCSTPPARASARCARWVAAQLPGACGPGQVLITTGSQQGLDLVARC